MNRVGDLRVRLVLVGAGHAHVEVLRRFILHPQPKVELTLISLDDRQHYSGMVPGYIRGTYREEEIVFDLPALAGRAGGRFVRGSATDLDPKAQNIMVADVGRIDYDLVSFNIGSSAAGADAVQPHAVLVKPLSRAVELRRRLQTLAEIGNDTTCHATVVGGGAAGVEVACAIAAVLDEGKRHYQVSLLEAAPTILSGYSERFRQRAADVLAHKNITILTNHRVCKVRSDAVEGENGVLSPSALTVWLSGAAASPIFRASGLQIDNKGFLLVDESLRALDQPQVFGVGDCATLAAHSDTPKAGVYAVRQGPVLWHGLMATINGATHPRYQPQHGFLSILNTADGRALLRYKGVVSHSRWSWRLKDWIDRRFMAKYQRLDQLPVL